MENRRKHFRHVFDSQGRLEVEIVPEKPVAVEVASSGQAEPIPAKMLNLSLGGMFVQLENGDIQLEKGEHVTAAFLLPESDVRLTFPAEVVHTQTSEESPSYGFRFRKEDVDEEQEKILWQFLSRAQREQNQVYYDHVRQQRQQNSKLLNQLRELQHQHNVVALVQSGGWTKYAYLAVIVLSLVAAGAALVVMYQANDAAWRDLLTKHQIDTKYGALPPDFEKLVPPKNVPAFPLATQKQRQLEADQERLENIQRLQEDFEKDTQVVQGEYDQIKTSAVTMGLSAGGTGIATAVVLLILLALLRPSFGNLARRNLAQKARLFNERYSKEVKNWGGPEALEDPTRVATLIRTLEERIAST